MDNKVEEGRSLIEDALGQRKILFGPEHRFTRKAERRLAAVDRGESYVEYDRSSDSNIALAPSIL